MSDIQSGTKKLPDLPKCCLVCLVGPALNNNIAIISKFQRKTLPGCNHKLRMIKL